MADMRVSPQLVASPGRSDGGVTALGGGLDSTALVRVSAPVKDRPGTSAETDDEGSAGDTGEVRAGDTWPRGAADWAVLSLLLADAEKSTWGAA